MVSSVCGGNQVRSTKTSVSCLQSSMGVGVLWSGAAWVLPALGSYSSLREPCMPTCTVTYWSRTWSRPFGDWATGQYSNMITTTALLKLRVKVMDWPSMSPDLNPIEHLLGILKRKGEERKVSNIHQLRYIVMERSVRGLQWQHVKLWWTPCPRGLRHCWKIMVATKNIDTLGPIWTFTLRDVLTFVASVLDMYCCALSYFEGTVNYNTVIQVVHSLLYIVAKCHFFSVFTLKYIIYLQKCKGALTSVRYCVYIYIYMCMLCVFKYWWLNVDCSFLFNW